MEQVLQLSSALRGELQRWAREAYPNEACGLLLGRRSEGCTRVLRARRATNLEGGRPTARFVLNPVDLLAAEQEALGAGLAVVGLWHSHPDGGAAPSSEDARHAWSGWSDLIVAVGPRGALGMRSWRWNGATFAEERCRICEPLSS